MKYIFNQHFVCFDHIGSCFAELVAVDYGIAFSMKDRYRRLPFGTCFVLVVQCWFLKKCYLCVLSSVIWSFWVLVNDPVLILKMCYFKNTKSLQCVW